MTKKQFLRSWIRNHGTWERRAYNVVQSTVKEIFGNIPTGNLTQQNWRAVIELNVTPEMIRAMVMDIWAVVGRSAGGWAIDTFMSKIEKAQGIDMERKNKPLFDARFQRLLAQYFDSEGGGKHIVTMTDTMKAAVIKAIETRFREGGEYSLEDIRDIITDFRQSGYPEWMALRIARTEVTGAANWAALQGLTQTKYKVRKEWISIDDERTRRTPPDAFDHLEMDGVTVAKDESFEQNGVSLLFPGDPNAQPVGKSAGMVINCRCAVNWIPVRDRNGRLVLADEQVPEIPKLDIPGTGDRPDLLGLSVTDWEDKVKGLDYERGAYYDMDGNMIYEMKGTKKSVPISRIGRDLPPGRNGENGRQLFFGNLFTHNHPQSGYDYPGYKGNEFSQSFSDADVSIFGYYGAQELRAKGTTGRVFRMFRNAPIQDLEGDFIYRNNRWYETVQPYFKRVSDNIMTEMWPWIDDGANRKEVIKRKNYVLSNVIHWTWEQFFGQQKYVDLYTYEGEVHNPDGFDVIPKRNRRFMEDKALPDSQADPPAEIDGDFYWNWIAELPNLR